MRRASPDSEAVASSEDERPWPMATTFGSLPRKENGVPGLGGGIWSSSQSRGSFKLGEQARRNAARETLMGAPNGIPARTADTPSPATSSDHGATSLPFTIPLQPTPKVGRSLSHSQGQREMSIVPFSSSASSQQAPTGKERPIALPLGLLHEEIEDGDGGSDRGSDLGGMLTQTVSHPVFSNLHRTTTLPTQFQSPFSASSNPRRSDTFDGSGYDRGYDRRYEVEFGDVALGEFEQSRRPQWQTSLGWEELPNYSESRRHSMADIPTRGSGITAVRHNTESYNEDDAIYLNLDTNNNTEDHDCDADMHRLTRGSLFSGGSTTTATDTSYTIPAGYSVPRVALAPHEQTKNANRIAVMPFGSAEVHKVLYIVSFKCSRVGCFFLLDNTGLVVREGDMVIVEADRGQDLGVVQHACVTPEEARILLAKYGEEQYKWLMMFSQNNTAGAINPNAPVYGDANGAGHRRPRLSTRPPREADAALKPKAIKRMAAPHEIRMLMEKEGNEAKAKRMCQVKVYQHRLDMEILDAEFQWDWQKLIFYYYADHYVDFKDLVNDLYKTYKVRLWMSAVNPASFSSNAVNTPPSGIGPGAINMHSQSGPNFDSSYTMSYGTDTDPYGAVPPYQVPYNTYTPNYPAIPGINNSFEPTQQIPAAQQQTFGLEGLAQQFGMMQPFAAQPQYAAPNYAGAPYNPQPPIMPPAQAQRRKQMEPIGAGRGLPQGQQQQQAVAARRNGQEGVNRLPASGDLDWEAIGVFRR